MKHDDEMILKEIQKNTQMSMTAIDTILDKIGNDEFSLQLSKQSLRYAQIHNKALDKILENDGEAYRSSQINDFLLKGNIHASTALNISTEHLAEMMIQGATEESPVCGRRSNTIIWRQTIQWSWRRNWLILRKEI